MEVGAGSLAPRTVEGQDAPGAETSASGHGELPAELTSTERATAEEAAEEARAAGLVSSLREAEGAEQRAFDAVQWALGAQEVASQEVGVAFPREAVRLAAARAQRRARLNRERGVAGRVGDPSVVGLDGADARALGGASTDLPMPPNREAVRALARLVRLVVAAESVPLPPRGSALRRWQDAMGWSDGDGTSVQVHPGVGGTREPGRFDDGGRGTGGRAFTLTYADVAFGKGDIRRAQLQAMGPNLMDPSTWARLERSAYAVGETALQGTSLEPPPGLHGPQVGTPPAPKQYVWRHGPGAGRLLRGPGGEVVVVGTGSE